MFYREILSNKIFSDTEYLQGNDANDFTQWKYLHF